MRHGLTSADDGKEIVFTDKGCYNKATKSAVFHCAAPVIPVPTFSDAHLTGTGGSVTVKGDGGLQLKALYQSSLEGFLARVSLCDATGTIVSDMDFGSSTPQDDGIEVGIYSQRGLTVGATYAFKVKVADNYGELHEYAQNITVTES